MDGLDHDYYSRPTKYFNDMLLGSTSKKHAQARYRFLRVAHDELDIERISGHVLEFDFLSRAILNWT